MKRTPGNLSSRLFDDWSGDIDEELAPLQTEEVLMGLFHSDGFTRGLAVDAYCFRFAVTEQFAKVWMKDESYWVRQAVLNGLLEGKWTRWKRRVVQRAFEKGDDLWVLRAGISVAFLRDPTLFLVWHGRYQDPDPSLVVIANALVSFLQGVDGEPEELMLAAMARGYEYTYLKGALVECSEGDDPLPERVQRLRDKVEAKFEQMRREREPAGPIDSA